MFVFLCLHARVPSYLEHSYLAKLDAVFCIFIVFFADKSCLSKCKIQVMLRLLSNMSNALEQIHIFKTSVVAKLIILYSHLNICHYIYFFSQFWVLMLQKKCPPPTWNLFFQLCFHGSLPGGPCLSRGLTSTLTPALFSNLVEKKKSLLSQFLLLLKNGQFSFFFCQSPTLYPTVSCV